MDGLFNAAEFGAPSAANLNGGRRLKAVELFAGAGVMAHGLSLAGFGHVLLAERDAHAVRTLQANSDPVSGLPFPVLAGDVRSVDWKAAVSGAVDLVAGGPPCQPWSAGGKANGPNDARDMWPEAVRAVRELRPRGFIFENVRGLFRPAFAEYLAWIKASLEAPSVGLSEGESAAGCMARLSDAYPEYEVTAFLVNAADYGSPQIRHRAVIAGVRKDVGKRFVAPSPTHSVKPSSPNLMPWKTVRDAIAGLGEPDGINGHVAGPVARAYPGHDGSSLDKPSKALKAGVHGVPGGENMFRLDDGSLRHYTAREAARLQGLPDSWAFPGSRSESMRQLGNAVPVELALALGNAMRAALV